LFLYTVKITANFTSLFVPYRTIVWWLKAFTSWLCFDLKLWWHTHGIEPRGLRG